MAADTVTQYTVDGISADHVDIVLVKSSDIGVTASGAVAFKGTNPGGSGNQALLTETSSDIVVVNGVSKASTDEVEVSKGSVTFSVLADGTDEYVPVVFVDAKDKNVLPLKADGTPTAAFGVGGTTQVLAPEALDNETISGDVEYFDTSAKIVQTGTTSYKYDSGDEFLIKRDGGTYKAATLAQFEAALSTGDKVEGKYRNKAANQSTFKLDDVAPFAPETIEVQKPGTDVATNSGKAGIELSFDNSVTETVVSYNIYRAKAIQPAITGQPVTSPTVDSGAYTKIGSVADVDKTKTTSYTYLDTSATVAATGSADPQWSYYITAVDKTGQEGLPSSVTAPMKASAAVSSSFAFKAYTEDDDVSGVSGLFAVESPGAVAPVIT